MQTYPNEPPVGSRDMNRYTPDLTHGQACLGNTPSGPLVNLFINVEDRAGKRSVIDVHTDTFEVLPHPYDRSGGNCAAWQNQAQLKVCISRCTISP
jgi:hypothetical protein